MPSGWSACARYTGIHSPLRGHRQTVCWATVAQNVGNECPNIGLVFGNILLALCDVLTDFSWCFNSLFSCIVLSLMILLQYFMILPWYFFLLFPRSLIECKYLCVSNILWYFQRKMRLWYFFREKISTCVKADRCYFFVCILTRRWRLVWRSFELRVWCEP